ncbi:MAG: hypothetical protein ACRD88_01735 [Terriglobia bacterium]
MADTLEVRIAHLEGAYEQIDKRLSSLEATVRSEVSSLRAEFRSELGTMRGELGTLRSEMREQFRWIIGFQIATMLSLIGTLLALFTRQ